MDAAQAYGILGVEPGASPKEVQLAYRRKALESHPDRAGSPEQAEYFSRQFLHIRDAYELLRKQGFPIPEPEKVVERPAYYSRTAGRSFAPKEGEGEKVGALEKLGFGFHIDMGSLLLWGMLIPAGGIGAVLFIKYLLKQLQIP
ncbi:MAG: DnaJ domain-containing protein [Elusimicrobiota bacterium]